MATAVSRAQDERATLARLVAAICRQFSFGLRQADRWLGALNDPHPGVVPPISIVDIR